MTAVIQGQCISVKHHYSEGFHTILHGASRNGLIFRLGLLPSRDIFLGRREIANVKLDDGSRFCLHEDLDKALDTISRLRKAAEEYGMHIAMAHDAEFIKDGSDAVLMSILHPMFDGTVLNRIKAHGRP